MLVKGECQFARLECFGSHCDAVNVVIETTAGSSNTYVYSQENRFFQLQRVIRPCGWLIGDIGFIPQTMDQDSRNIRAIVLAKEPTFVGCVVEATVVGAISLTWANQIVVVTIPVAQAYQSNQIRENFGIEEDERGVIARSLIARLFDENEVSDSVYFEWLSNSRTIAELEKASAAHLSNSSLEFEERFEGDI